MIIPKALTVKEVNAIKKVGLTAIGGAVGLYLLVKESGNRYYVFRYKAKDGKRSFVSIAPFGAIDLAEARRRAKEWKLKVDDGINPAEAKRAEAAEIRLQAELKQRETEKALRTFNYVSALWFDERARSGFWSKNAVGEAHTMRFLTNYIRPIVGKVPISDLDAHHVFDAIIPTYQSKPNTAEKCLTIISSVWKWSKAKGWASGENPADRKGTLGVLLEPYKNDRAQAVNYPALAPEDMPDFMVALRNMDAMSARLTEFLILTATRSKMARMLKWSDIDFKNRIAVVDESSIKTKGMGKHIVFLSDQVLSLLKGLKRECDWVFPNLKGKPFSDATPGDVIRRLHEASVSAGGKGWIDPEQSKEQGKPVVVTIHGTARATFKTWTRTGKNRKLLDEEAVELCMAHNLKDAYDGAYNRARLETERRQVMQAWADYCYSMVK